MQKPCRKHRPQLNCDCLACFVMLVRRLHCWLIAYINSLLWPMTPCNFLYRYQSLWELTASVFRVEVILPLKCDDTRAETRSRLSAKRTSQFKSAGASVQSATGSRGVRISSSNAGYTMFRGSVKGTCYPLHSPVSPSLPFPCVTVSSHFNWTLPSYQNTWRHLPEDRILNTYHREKLTSDIDTNIT
jgi:hypothetical protein